MSNIELHASPLSPPSQAVHMVLDLLGLDYKYVEVTMSTEYLSMSPVLTYDNLVITESRVAMTYLVSKHMPSMLTYPKHGLYPKISDCYQKMMDCVYPVISGKTSTVPLEKKEILKRDMKMINQMTGGGYVLGSRMTIADVDLLATFSTLEACDFINLEEYENLKDWAERMKMEIPRYGRGAVALGECFNDKYKTRNV